MNLLKETLEALKHYNKKESEIIWIGSDNGEYVITWNKFKDIAKNINYNSGYGGQEIAVDLVIVGNNWWLSRGEYDGSEWWEFNTIPIKAREPNIIIKEFNKVKGDSSWESLELINKEENRNE